ncbi:L,D-transpeptidase family protein [Flavobacterium tibetense]|jgi:L,D-transpeptidase YcbB|uniref:Peptidoglycan-binding protein n=1 Tax=Flavobacterium tibetense TaxID=2233533 RepID=A0A365P4K0_9FLAO|nr:L,D-transpeptidase family protein [Flavobacterium tibetense]RBA29526.1 peptidoglycan-binding protein [Flavobacterium tibetense]
MNPKLLIIVLLALFLANCQGKEDNRKEAIEDAQQKKTSANEIIRPVSIEKLKTVNDSIKRYYAVLQNYEIWYNSNNRKDLINEIKLCYREGLNPSDYNLEEIEKLEEKREKLTDDEIIAYDILLTTNFEKLANHLHAGKLNPKKLYSDWDLEKKEIALSQKLENAIKENKVATLFKNIKPQDEIYRKIKKSLLVLEKYPDYKFGKISLKNKIVVNDTTDVIIDIKKRLAYWKDYQNRDSIITNVYDSLTVLAVKRFQRRHNLAADGVIGLGTIKALNYSKNERREQIIANLERWKWFPNDFGETYLLVNLPEYKLSYVVNKDTITTERIIIGKASRKTPILTSKLTNFVFNPTWTVPPTILKEDLTPAASKSSGYFEKNRITIYNNKGEIISAEDWSPENARSYRYVQRPGSDNSLGLVKFNFSNRHSVYLHDTNNRGYFTRENRAVSSGCVRVENPLRLAKKIMKKEDNDWSLEKIDEIIAKKNSKLVPIKSDVKVHLLYWTNTLDKNQLIFYEDCYNLDKEVFNKLRN